MTDQSHTSTPAILGALLFAAGRAVDGADGSVPQHPDRMLGSADTDIVTEVDAVLQTQVPGDSARVKCAVAEVANAILTVRALPRKPGLTAARYDADRTVVHQLLGTGSSKGASVWPPTSQTAVQRFGSWNAALTAAGLATSSIGRARGQLRFDEAAYDAAIVAFLTDSGARGVAATYREYELYAGEHKGDVPSAAAVRKFYGSWKAALTSAR